MLEMNLFAYRLLDCCRMMGVVLMGAMMTLIAGA
jgi:hypothetical protein